MDKPTVIVVTETVVHDLSSGHELRMYNLINELSKEFRVVNVVIDILRPAGAKEIAKPLVHPKWFRSYPPTQTLGRYLRLSERSYLRAMAPSSFDEISRKIGETFEAERAVAIVVFSAHLCTLIPPSLRKCTVVDVNDCMSLTIGRRLRSGAGSPIRSAIGWARWRRFELWIANEFPEVVATSEVDAKACSSRTKQVKGLPQGVSVTPVGSANGTPLTRAVGFWGNLDFEPNRDAVLNFSRSVVLKGLLPKDVVFRVIGKGADEEVAQLGTLSSQIRLEGFTPSLSESLAGVPIMMNYMTLGSGIKNKVLEAFAWRLAVVSTARGVEGFQGIVDGDHYIRAETPEEFASAIQRLLNDEPLRTTICDKAQQFMEMYRWENIGKRLVEMVGTAAANGKQSGQVPERL